MLEAYKVKGAIYALEEFTVDDLSRYSGVKKTSVHTVLTRLSHLIEKTTHTPETRTPGGQPITFRLRPDQHHVLKNELTQLLTEMKKHLPAPDTPQVVKPPLPLLLARQAVLDLRARTKPPEVLQTIAEKLKYDLIAARAELDTQALAPDSKESADSLLSEIESHEKALADFHSPNSPRLSGEMVHFLEECSTALQKLPHAGIVFINALEDAWSRSLCSWIKPVRQFSFKPSDLETIVDCVRREGESHSVVIAFDSKDRRRGGRSLAAEVCAIEVQAPVFLFDRAFDAQIRNAAFGRHLDYYGAAEELTSDFIRAQVADPTAHLVTHLRGAGGAKLLSVLAGWRSGTRDPNPA